MPPTPLPQILLEQPAHAEGARYGADERSQQHARQADDIDHQLELIGLVHTYARLVDARETPQEL